MPTPAVCHNNKRIVNESCDSSVAAEVSPFKSYIIRTAEQAHAQKHRYRKRQDSFYIFHNNYSNIKKIPIFHRTNIAFSHWNHTLNTLSVRAVERYYLVHVAVVEVALHIFAGNDFAHAVSYENIAMGRIPDITLIFSI